MLSAIVAGMYQRLGGAADINTSNSLSQITTSSSSLSKFMFVLGQTTLCSLVYTETLASIAKKFPPLNSDRGQSGAGDADAGTKKLYFCVKIVFISMNFYFIFSC